MSRACESASATADASAVTETSAIAGASMAGRVIRPLSVDMLDAVMAIENQAYDFPWTRGNFVDSIAAGYLTQASFTPAGELIGYFVAMSGCEEMHLLNLTVAAPRRGQGHARALLAELYRLSAEQGARAIWLEVRRSNTRAQQVYLRQGFVEVGCRPQYYPAPGRTREDAVLMTLALTRKHRHAVG